jgi:hypothetical protein
LTISEQNLLLIVISIPFNDTKHAPNLSSVSITNFRVRDAQVNHKKAARRKPITATNRMPKVNNS